MMNQLLFPDPEFLGIKPFPGRSPKNYRARLQRQDWWGEIVPRICRRAMGRCERCRKKSRHLETHHWTYERFWRELDEDLQALCRSCHRRADQERRKADRAWFASHKSTYDPEWEWCAKRWGDDDRDWPDDASERFEAWCERKEEMELLDAAYHV